MSYEGHEQLLCKNGHLWEEPCNYGGASVEDSICPHCQEKAVFCNSVDDTNYYGENSIPAEQWEKLKISEGKTETCNLGHLHILEQPRYRVPSPKELKHIRVCFNLEQGALCYPDGRKCDEF